jgi:cellulose biosynthesis protein BcsQ
MDTKFREASAQGKPILHTAPTSRGAQEYLALAQEILIQHLPEAA